MQLPLGYSCVASVFKLEIENVFFPRSFVVFLSSDTPALHSERSSVATCCEAVCVVLLYRHWSNYCLISICCIMVLEILWTQDNKLKAWKYFFVKCDRLQPGNAVVTKITGYYRKNFLYLLFSVIHDSTPYLPYLLLLLAELFVHTSSRPTASPSLCGMLRSKTLQVDRLMSSSKKLHDLVRIHTFLAGWVK